MDFQKLNREELKEFLNMYNVSTNDETKLVDLASQLFNQLKSIKGSKFPEPVVDLFMATQYLQSNRPIPMYEVEDILNFEPEETVIFSQAFHLDPKRPDFKHRLVRMLFWIGSLSEHDIQTILQLLDKSCGFTDWRKFNPEYVRCNNTKTVSRELRNSFLGDVQTSGIILFHLGDAVKHAQTEVEAEKYDLIPSETVGLDYFDKAEFFRDAPEHSNFKRWTRQQWPHNTIRYAINNNIKLTYVQSDTVYCLYPSLFAEVMCGTLYSEEEHPENTYFRFSGSLGSLYNVGEFSVGNELKSLVKRLYPNKFVTDSKILRNDLEWARMSDEFLDDVYSRIMYGQQIDVKYSYLYLPWEDLKLNNPIRPVTVKVTAIPRKITYHTATYLDELPFDDRNYLRTMKPGGPRYLPSWHIPLSYIFDGDQGEFFVGVQVYVVQPIYISQKVSFDGTYNDPIIYVEDEPLDRELVHNLINLL